MKSLYARGSSLSRLLIAPVALTLVSGSLIAGYAHGRQHEIRTQRDVEMQLVQFDPGNSTHRGGSPDRDRDSPSSNLGTDDLRANSQASSADDDPVQSYKTAIALLKKDYYGATIDDKKTQQLTYEAIRGLLFSLRDQFTS